MFFSLALLICAVSLQEGARRIEVKSSPLEDWRTLSQRAASMVATKKLYFYALDDGPSNLRWQVLVNNFYLCGTEAATPCADRWGRNGPQVKKTPLCFISTSMRPRSKLLRLLLPTIRWRSGSACSNPPQQKGARCA